MIDSNEVTRHVGCSIALDPKGLTFKYQRWYGQEPAEPTASVTVPPGVRNGEPCTLPRWGKFTTVPLAKHCRHEAWES